MSPTQREPKAEDKSDRNANKAQQGTHIYTYDELNRMVSSNIAKTLTAYTYDTLGNLTYEKVKNKNIDYQYNELNQLVYRQDSQNQTYTYAYDLRGNRIAETGKKESREYVYDETNRLVEGTNWKGDKSAYTYNGLGVRINNTHTTHSGSVYDRDYVIDYTSLERDDLMVYAEGNGQLEYVQREVYAGSERIEQFTDRSRGGYERLLYVHEDLQGNTRYYTKATGQSFAELTYDAWGMPESPNKLLNNDHGNYVYATYTGHIFDTTLDIYFCEARFYDASTRTWMAMDPVKDGGNWYQYCYGNPLKYWDPLGLTGFETYGCGDKDDEGNTFQWHNVGISSALYQYEKNGGDLLALNYFLMSLAGSRSVTTLGNWVTLYNAPTIDSIGRLVTYPDNLTGRYIYSNTVLGWYSQEPKPNPYANISDMRLVGNTYMANGDRYVVALGPEVMLPGYPLDGKVGSTEFSYGTNVDVVITDAHGNTYFIPCTLGDVKTHTYPNGVYQTGEVYPYAYGNPADSPNDANGSMVEFVTKESLSVFRNYSLKEVIVYD